MMTAASSKSQNGESDNRDEFAGRRKGLRWPFVLGVVFFALALLALLYELWTVAGSGSYRPIAAGELWFTLHPYSLNLSQAVIQRYLLPSLWDPIIVSLLQWPAWSLLGAPAAALMFLFYPRNR